MKILLNSIEKLKNSDISKVVDKKMKEFKNVKRKEIFSELCFCLLTANFNGERSIKIQNEIGDGFSTLSKKQLAKKLKELGHRYPNARAKYIVEARKHKLEMDRKWLVKNVKGLGMKESSHFLRNVGFNDYAIIDFHIVDLLVKNNLIERPKTLTKKKYLEIESILRWVACQTNTSLGELDMYLWYLETGKILK